MIFYRIIITGLIRSAAERGVFPVTSNPFNRFYTTDVTVVHYKKDDYSGETDRQVLGTLKADVQPYSGGKAHEEYGLDIECQMRMFCDADENISVKNCLEIAGTKYEIVHVAPWNMGLEVILKLMR